MFAPKITIVPAVKPAAATFMVGARIIIAVVKKVLMDVGNVASFLVKAIC